MERLINDGADVNAKGKDNMTPLLWAFPDNKPERFKLLLEKGANPNVFVKSTLNTNRPPAFVPGDSVTTLSAKSGFPDHFRLVMEHGGDPNLVHPVDKESVLQIIIKYGPKKKERIALLIKKGADLNLNRGSTPPVMNAVSFLGQYDLALYLLESGADPNQYMASENKKLVHLVINEKKRVDLAKDPAVIQAYEKLVGWLKNHGQSFEEAQADLDRWAALRAKSAKEFLRVMKNEVAERKAREATEKAKKDGAGGEKRP